MTLTRTVITLATLGDLTLQNSGVYCVVTHEVAKACKGDIIVDAHKYVILHALPTSGVMAQ
jgi:hypothetical protein